MNLKIRIMPNKWSINNLCLYIFFVMTTVIFLYQYSGSMFNIRYGFMAVGALLGFWTCLTKRIKFYQPIMLLIIMVLCWVFCFLGQRGYLNYSFSNLLYTILYIGLSVVLLGNEYNHKIALALYIFAAFTILLKLFQNVNINHILLANSRNFISVLLLLPLLLYYISCHDKGKPFYVFPAISYFYISIYAIGRGGIISSGFLVVALCIYKAAKIENKSLRRLMGMVIIAILATTAFYLSNLDTIIIDRFLNTNFSRFALKGVTDVSREGVWQTFWINNKSSLQEFLLGSDVSMARDDGNLHNSFLQAYASFGLLGFLTIVILLIRSLRQGIKNKDTLFIILLVGLSLRAFTDRVFFQGYCEIFLYYFILYWDHRKWTQKSQPSLNGFVS